jgi:undecaprenyl-diphosphatase
MIVLAPGLALWNVAQHAGWLAPAVIASTAGCAIAAPLLLILAWLKPAGLRCVLAAGLAPATVVMIRHAAASVVFVPRPFIADHFVPLYPHAPDSSFPSATTGYFAGIAVPVLACWRRLGWLLAAITAEVAFGCVYVGVHYGTDVLAGIVIGAASGAAAWRILGVPPAARLLAALDDGLRQGRLRPRRSSVAVSQVSDRLLAHLPEVRRKPDLLPQVLLHLGDIAECG